MMPRLLFVMCFCLNVSQSATTALGQGLIADAPTPPLTLNEVTTAVLSHQLNEAKTQEQLSRWDASKGKVQAGDDLSFSLSNELGLRFAAPASSSKQNSSFLTLPDTWTPFQSHALVGSKPLYDFGVLDLRVKKLEAERSLIPLTLEEERLTLRWTAARYLLEARIEAALVEALSAVEANAAKRAKTIAREYQEGLRSEADYVRSRADALRARLSLARVQESLGAALNDLEAHMGSTTQLRPRIRPIKEHSLRAWSDLFAKLDIAKSTSVAPLPEGVSQPHQLPTSPALADLQLTRIARQRQVLQQDLALARASNGPRLSGELGARLPGELFPLKPNLFAQLSLQWPLGASATARYEEEEILADLRILTTEEAAVRRQQLIDSRDATIETDHLLEQLNILAQQKTTLSQLAKLTQRKFYSGTASSLELSTVEADLLTSTSEAVRFQSDIYRQLLSWAQVRGRFEMMMSLLDDVRGDM